MKKKQVRVPISTARARLFDLAELVRQGGDTAVILEQRGRTEQVALVRETHLAYLEEQAARRAEPHEPAFQLAGSLTSTVDDAALETALHELRRAWSMPPRAAGPARRRNRPPRGSR